MNLLLQQLGKLLATLGPEDQKATLTTLKIIFKNITEHPNEDKFCQIKLDNERFSSQVWRYPAGKELIKMSGWIVEGDHVRLSSDTYVQTVLAITSQKLKVSSLLYVCSYTHVVNYYFL